MLPCTKKTWAGLNVGELLIGAETTGMQHRSTAFLQTSSKPRRSPHSKIFQASWTVVDLLLEHPGINLGQRHQQRYRKQIRTPSAYMF